MVAVRATPIEQRTRLLHLIHRHGLARIVGAMHNPGIMAMEGWDLTRWRRNVLDGGALLLSLVDMSGTPTDPDGLLTALYDARALVRRSNPAAWSLDRMNRECRCGKASHSDIDRKHEVDAAVRRENELNWEIKALVEARGEQAPPVEPVLAAVLCVNAEPSAWHSWLKGVAQLPMPTALLLCAAGGKVIYGSTPFTQPRAPRVPLRPLEEIEDLPFPPEMLAGPAFRGPDAFHIRRQR